MTSIKQAGVRPKFRFQLVLVLATIFSIGLLNPILIKADSAGFETDYEGDVLASDPLIVNSMKTTMYEYVTDDEEIEDVHNWIKNGSRNNEEFKDVVMTVMKDNCTKCHSKSSTMSDAVPDKPLSTYEDVVKYLAPGLPAKPSK